MDVGIAIGENHRFELREALLIYCENRNAAFITRHQVSRDNSETPSLGPARPLTVSFVEDLTRSLGGRTAAEILPDNILAKTDRMIAWWTPRQHRQMFYQNVEKKSEDLNGRIFPQPPLVWRAQDGELKIRALKQNQRPNAETKLAVAPFWNLSDNGTLCTGSMRRPTGSSVATVALWERGFYESAFTHANVGRLTRHAGGFEGLWSGLAGKRTPFPADSLIELPETLQQFVSERC
jgi:PRTRC genetic system protein B